MDQAKLKENYYLGERIIEAGTLVSAKEANEYFNITKIRGVFVCPICNIEVFCAKQTSNLEDMKPREKNPYFKEKGGLDKHHDACPFKSNSNANKKTNKLDIKSETHYYSKLVEPYRSRSEKINSNNQERTNYSNEKIERIDSYTAGNIDPFCDQYLKITRDCWKSNINSKEVLSLFKLSLPQTKNTNHYQGFRHVNGKLKSGKSRIYHGEIKYSILCEDGLILVFHEPKTDNNYHRKPVFVIIDSEYSFQFEADKLHDLNSDDFLKRHSNCFVYGNLEENNNYFSITLKHLNWISLKAKSNTKKFKISYERKSRFCEELMASTSKKMLTRYYNNLGINDSLNEYDAEQTPETVTNEQCINLDEPHVVEVIQEENLSMILTDKEDKEMGELDITTVDLRAEYTTSEESDCEAPPVLTEHEKNPDLNVNDLKNNTQLDNQHPIFNNALAEISSVYQLVNSEINGRTSDESDNNHRPTKLVMEPSKKYDIDRKISFIQRIRAKLLGKK